MTGSHAGVTDVVASVPLLARPRRGIDEASFAGNRAFDGPVHAGARGGAGARHLSGRERADLVPAVLQRQAHERGAVRRQPGRESRDPDNVPGPEPARLHAELVPRRESVAFERVTFTPESETHEIWVVNVDGSNPHRLFPCPGDDVCRAALLASWSPDGQWIAFSLATGPVTNHQSADVRIWAIHPDGTGLRQITQPTGFQRSEDFDPQWSPDGTRIVFERRLARRDWKPAIFTADSTDGSDVERVSPKGLLAGDSPDWSPDGRWIIYRNDEAPGTQQVFLSHPDGSGFRVLIDGGREVLLHVVLVLAGRHPDDDRRLPGRR